MSSGLFLGYPVAILDLIITMFFQGIFFEITHFLYPGNRKAGTYYDLT